jgi:hypothetical protein
MKSIVLSAGLAVMTSATALAQEAPLTPAATQPSPESFVLRTSIRYWQFDGGEPSVARDGFLLEERLRLAFGVTKEFSIEANLPIYQSSFDRTPTTPANADLDAVGLGDLELLAKLRVWKGDLGPVDTTRLAIFAGTELPTSTVGFGSRSFDPVIGLTSTTILGRHGIGASAAWRFTTADADTPLLPGDSIDDALTGSLAYLYRIAPEEFGAEHVGAWYAVAELLGTYETNGDRELGIAPGILYEGPRWAFEAGVILPVYREVDYRPTASFGAYLGLRFLF